MSYKEMIDVCVLKQQGRKSLRDSYKYFDQ
ncbi:hypothetical protein [Enterobacter asburiae]